MTSVPFKKDFNNLESQVQGPRCDKSNRVEPHPTHTGVALAVLLGLLYSSLLAPYLGSATLSILSPSYNLSWTRSEWQYIVFVSVLAITSNWVALLIVLLALRGFRYPIPEYGYIKLWIPVGFLQIAVSTPVGFCMLPPPPQVNTTLDAGNAVHVYVVGGAIVAIMYYAFLVPILEQGNRRKEATGSIMI
ncbi:hypothetical protein AX16_010126 [Volvariella volvacea WC 439]|nr:hypothetical protein AX16_010126 [Volvariella volvacea WC 439]